MTRDARPITRDASPVAGDASFRTDEGAPAGEPGPLLRRASKSVRVLLVHDQERAQAVEVVRLAGPAVVVRKVADVRSLADVLDVRQAVRAHRHLLQDAGVPA